MEKIVQEMVRIEEMAATVLDKAHAEQRMLPRRIDEEIQRRVSNIDADTQKAINRLHTDATQETERKIKDIAKRSKVASRQVEAAFLRHRDEWRKELTQRIICASDSKR
jgi:uncharacterized membrane protein YgaE (UPF0421/DUF939 family)